MLKITQRQLRNKKYDPNSTVKTMDLSKNDLDDIPLVEIQLFSQISVVNLQQNQIKNLQPLLSLNNYLKELNLSQNCIENLYYSKNNKIISYFESLPKLKKLDLSHNSIKNLQSSIFEKNLELQVIKLGSNNISRNLRCFIPLKKLKILDLSNNLLNDWKVFDVFKTKKLNIQEFILFNNPLYYKQQIVDKKTQLQNDMKNQKVLLDCMPFLKLLNGEKLKCEGKSQQQSQEHSKNIIPNYIRQRTNSLQFEIVDKSHFKSKEQQARKNSDKENCNNLNLLVTNDSLIFQKGQKNKERSQSKGTKMILQMPKTTTNKDYNPNSKLNVLQEQQQKLTTERNTKIPLKRNILQPKLISDQNKNRIYCSQLPKEEENNSKFIFIDEKQIEYYKNQILQQLQIIQNLQKENNELKRSLLQSYTGQEENYKLNLQVKNKFNDFKSKMESIKKTSSSKKNQSFENYLENQNTEITHNENSKSTSKKQSNNMQQVKEVILKLEENDEETKQQFENWCQSFQDNE